jgi:hypothetical protein
MKAVLLLFIASLCCSVLASLLGSPPAARILGAPAVLLSGWAALGHFITIDDDAPGGWSNPDNSQAYWRTSLAELALKAGAFAVALVVVGYWPSLRSGV